MYVVHGNWLSISTPPYLFAHYRASRQLITGRYKIPYHGPEASGVARCTELQNLRRTCTRTNTWWCGHKGKRECTRFIVSVFIRHFQTIVLVQGTCVLFNCPVKWIDTQFLENDTSPYVVIVTVRLSGRSWASHRSMKLRYSVAPSRKTWRVL